MYACLTVGSRVKFIFLVPTIFCILALKEALQATRSHLIPLSNRQQIYLFGSDLILGVVGKFLGVTNVGATGIVGKVVVVNWVFAGRGA